MLLLSALLIFLVRVKVFSLCQAILFFPFAYASMVIGYSIGSRLHNNYCSRQLGRSYEEKVVFVNDVSEEKPPSRSRELSSILFSLGLRRFFFLFAWAVQKNTVSRFS